jgi:hypothetical protein
MRFTGRFKGCATVYNCRRLSLTAPQLSVAASEATTEAQVSNEATEGHSTLPALNYPQQKQPGEQEKMFKAKTAKTLFQQAKDLGKPKKEPALARSIYVG